MGADFVRRAVWRGVLDVGWMGECGVFMWRGVWSVECGVVLESGVSCSAVRCSVAVSNVGDRCRGTCVCAVALYNVPTVLNSC